MSRTQRIALLAAAAIVAVLAIVVLSGGDDDNPQPASQTQPAQQEPAGAETDTGTDDNGTDDAEPAATPRPAPKPPLLQAGGERQLTFTKGDRVRFRVRSAAAEEVHVHGYDIKRELAAGETATIAFPATIEGIFEVELERSATPLGTIKVEPQ